MTRDSFIYLICPARYVRPGSADLESPYRSLGEPVGQRRLNVAGSGSEDAVRFSPFVLCTRLEFSFRCFAILCYGGPCHPVGAAVPRTARNHILVDLVLVSGSKSWSGSGGPAAHPRVTTVAPFPAWRGSQPTDCTGSGACQSTSMSKFDSLAERVGFEPTVRFPVHSISSAAS